MCLPIASQVGQCGWSPVKRSPRRWQLCKHVWKFLDGDISKEPHSAIFWWPSEQLGSTSPALLRDGHRGRSRVDDQVSAREPDGEVSHSTMLPYLSDGLRCLWHHSEKLQKELVELKGARAAAPSSRRRRDTGVSVVDPDKVNLACPRYQAVYGAKSVPRKDAEPTAE